MLRIADRVKAAVSAFASTGGGGTTTDIVEAVKRSVELTVQSYGDMYRGMDWTPTNDKLVTAHTYALYDQMQTDAKIRAALKQKSNAVAKLDWEIEPVSRDKEDLRIAKFLTDAYNGFEGSVSGLTIDFLDATAKGVSVIEPVFYVEKRGDWAGCTMPAYFAPKDPADFEFKIDSWGRLEAVRNKTQTGVDKPIDPAKLIVFTYDGRYRLPWGHSDLTAVYKHWRAKDFLIKWWNVYNQVYAMPQRYAKIPNSSFYNQAKRDQILDVLKSMMNNTSFWLPEDVEFNVVQVATGTMSYNDAIRFHDEAIVAGILGSSLTVERSQGQLGGGSALGGVHEATTSNFIDVLRKDIEELYFEKINKLLIRWNFPGVLTCPRFRFFDRKAASSSDIYALRALAEGGFVSLKTDMNEIRRRTGFPAMTDAEIAQAVEDKEKRDMLLAGSGAGGGGVNIPGGPEFAAEEPEKFAAAKPFWRPLHPAEERADMFARAEKMDRGEVAVMGAVRPVMEKIRNQIVAYVGKRVFVDGKFDETALRAMQVQHTGALNKAFAEEFGKLTRDALNDGARAVGIGEEAFNFAAVIVSAQRQSPVVELEKLKKWEAEGNQEKVKRWREGRAEAVMNKAERRAFWATDVVSEDVLREVKDAIYAGLDNGRSEAAIIDAVGKVFEGYIAREGNMPAVLSSAPRLATIVRTNVTRLFAESHLELAQDPLIRDSFPGIMYTAIMDAAVCPECEKLDGSVFPAGDPIWGRITPPLHHNCRCDVVPVPGEEIGKFAPESKALSVLKNVPKGFGGDA